MNRTTGSGALHASLFIGLCATGGRLRATATPQPGPPLTIHRATGPITLDGDLGDPGWRGATPITEWHETNVSDNGEPAVKSVAMLAYDDKYFYAAFELSDPDPSKIRAPVADHDGTPGSTDYAGVLIDSRNDGKSAQMFLANVNGTEYDALTNDATGEDSSPDYFWDAVGKVTPTGWNLEIRIPFSTLRYESGAAPTFGILLYRNYPRDRRYQFFSARLPREVSCFICNSSKLTGLENLPHGKHLVIAPYATATRTDEPVAGLGSPLDHGKIKTDGGLDVKWNPSADSAVDLTINPDFSQIESDTAQISSNERFALFFPEKRPFFLEGIDLFSFPMQAVYTRTVTSPRDGLHVTGKFGDTAYTLLAAEDRGGGLVVLPGPQGSGFAPQDYESWVGIVRVKHDLGSSFVSFLGTVREIAGGDGGGHNRVVGPDFQWRPTVSDVITGQWLFSETQSPKRTDLAPEWDGRKLSGRAWHLGWSHNTATHDWFINTQELGDDFRADNGFIPQVGYFDFTAGGGRTFRPKDNFFNRIRLFGAGYRDTATADGRHLLARGGQLGAGMDGRWDSFFRFELNRDDFLVGNALIHRFRPRVLAVIRPSYVFNDLSLDVHFGDEVDFANARKGTGVSASLFASIRPTDHLEFRLQANRRWIDENDGAGRSGRLFTADVLRLRTTYNFTSRMFARVIGQRVSTRRDPLLYSFPVEPKSGAFSAAALVVYKLDWQTVAFLGYGDNREYLAATDQLEKAQRQIFLKVSYAWQR